MRSSDESPRQICSLDPLPHEYARILVRATASELDFYLVSEGRRPGSPTGSFNLMTEVASDQDFGTEARLIHLRA